MRVGGQFARCPPDVAFNAVNAVMGIQQHLLGMLQKTDHPRAVVDGIPRILDQFNR